MTARKSSEHWSGKFKEMKKNDIRTLKEKIWRENGRRCPVLGKEVQLDKMALDHAHKRNAEEYSETKGVVREALDFRANAVLGKLENAIVRTGLSKEEGFEIGEFLRNAADYFERGGYVDENGTMYIHPNEVHREPKVSRKNYNALKKVYSGKKKFPEYPKTGKLTLWLKVLFEEYEINPFNESDLQKPGMKIPDSLKNL